MSKITMLDSNQLKHFMEQFFGYGSLSSSFWFVGMEEGGGNTEREISERLGQWEALGRGTVVDIAQFHEGIHDAKGRSMNYFFERRPKLQRTWAGLIRILLASRTLISLIYNYLKFLYIFLIGAPGFLDKLLKNMHFFMQTNQRSRGEDDESTEAVRSVQASRWGRSNSDGCLLELLPLPSPRTGQWYCNAWTDIPELRSREIYYESLTNSRIVRLKSLVRDHAPRSVVFLQCFPQIH